MISFVRLTWADQHKDVVGSPRELVLEISPNEQQKIFGLLQKMFPNDSNELLLQKYAMHIRDKKLILQKSELSKIQELLEQEPGNSSLLNKIENSLLGTAQEVTNSVSTLQSAFSSNPLMLMTDEYVGEKIDEKLKGSIGEKLVKRYPKLRVIAIKTLKDKEAIPGLLELVKKESQLKKFARTTLFIQVISLLMFFIFFRELSLFKKFLLRSASFITLQVILTIYFIWIFLPELSPLLNIIRANV
jgi:outer membrane lipopolysaccharide assembly protein LptE/RlpB